MKQEELKKIHKFLRENKDFAYPQEMEDFLQEYECSDILGFSKSVNNLYYYLLLYICCDENTEEQSILWVKGIRYAYRNIITYLEYSPIIWDKLKLDLQGDFKTNLFYVRNDLHKNIKEDDIELREKMLDIPTFCTFENIEYILRLYAKNDIVKAYVLNEMY